MENILKLSVRFCVFLVGLSWFICVFVFLYNSFLYCRIDLYDVRWVYICDGKWKEWLWMLFLIKWFCIGCILFFCFLSWLMMMNMMLRLRFWMSCWILLVMMKIIFWLVCWFVWVMLLKFMMNSIGWCFWYLVLLFCVILWMSMVLFKVSYLKWVFNLWFLLFCLESVSLIGVRFVVCLSGLGCLWMFLNSGLGEFMGFVFVLVGLNWFV